MKKFTVFQISNDAKDLPLFKHAGEHLGTREIVEDYAELKVLAEVVKDHGGWRQILSSFWVLPNGLRYKGYKYETQEHAYQAARFMNDNRKEALDIFSLDTGDSKRYIKDAEMAKNYGDKILKDVHKEDSRLLQEVLMQKFICNFAAKEILLATNYAFLKDNGNELNELMLVREILRSDLIHSN
jgi:predicted NAD-dependent protein-ADP-ribosyltransferase YbiA (DUF1768 family)